MVVVEFKGIASGQREVLSMMVNRWVKPLDAGELVPVCVAEVPGRGDGPWPAGSAGRPAHRL
jgi:hypothetical protein